MAHLEHILQVLRRAACSTTTVQAGISNCACNFVASTSRQHHTHLVRPFSSYATPKAGSNGSSMRRVPVSRTNGSATAAAGAGAESSPGQSSSSWLEMSNEVPGGSKPLRTWEKYYWGVGVVVISTALYWNLKKPEKTAEQIEAAKKRAAELEVQRKEHIRAVLMGSNFLEGDRDPLDGLSPKQIELFMEKHSIDPLDPLEGLTPEEIDAYVRQQEARRQAAD